MGEFFHATVTRKKLLEVDKTHVALEPLRYLKTASPEEAIVAEAIGYHERYQLRYWDALILAAAKHSGCVTVLSEDLNEGQLYDGVTVVNPFSVPAP